MSRNEYEIKVRCRILVRFGDRLVNPAHVVSVEECRDYDLVTMTDGKTFEAPRGSGQRLEVQDQDA